MAVQVLVTGRNDVKRYSNELYDDFISSRHQSGVVGPCGYKTGRFYSNVLCVWLEYNFKTVTAGGSELGGSSKDIEGLNIVGRQFCPTDVFGRTKP